MRDGASELVDAIRAADPQTLVWSWADDHSVGSGPAGWRTRPPCTVPTGPVWEHGHAKGDVAVRGGVVDLMLVLMRRVPPGDAPIDVLGDTGVFEHWLDYTRF